MASQVMARIHCTLDDCEIPISVEALKQSYILRTMLQDMEYGDAGPTEPIPIYNISGDVMEKVAKWCEHHRKDPLTDGDDDKHEKTVIEELAELTCDDYEVAVPTWDAELLQGVDGVVLKGILAAADFLEIPLLEEYAGIMTARRISGMSTQQMPEFFDIETDYTPEEEQEVRDTHAWVAVEKEEPRAPRAWDGDRYNEEKEELLHVNTDSSSVFGIFHIMHLVDKLVALGPVIQKICNVSGIAGLSYGILHNDEIVHTASFGLADLARKIPCDAAHTAFVIGSLSKAFTASLIASLIDDNDDNDDNDNNDNNDNNGNNGNNDGIPPLSWDTKLSTILPEFYRDGDDDASNKNDNSSIYNEITIADLLSHRTGLAPQDSLWLASNNVPFLPRSEAIRMLSSAPPIASLRTHFLYNNFAYEVLGQVIEKVAGRPFSAVLREWILHPLGMKHTYYIDESDRPQEGHEALSYAALENGSFVKIPTAFSAPDVIMGPAGGIRSTVNDLLVFYRAFMAAARDEMDFFSSSSSSSSFHPKEDQQQSRASHNPIRLVLQQWHPHISLPSSPYTLRERSYAQGWFRAQLPSYLFPWADGPSAFNPVVGSSSSSSSRFLALYHAGSIPGSYAYSLLLPETGHAVAVLTNSISTNGAVMFVGNLLVETVLEDMKKKKGDGNNSSGDDDDDDDDESPEELYLRLAEESAGMYVRAIRQVNDTLASLPGYAHERVVAHESDVADLKKTKRFSGKEYYYYTGRYYNAVGNFFIEIKSSEKNTDNSPNPTGLQVSFQGRPADTFTLFPYHDSDNDDDEASVYWALSYDELVALAREPGEEASSIEYHILRFRTTGAVRHGSSSTTIHCLQWRHSPDLPVDGEVFCKKDGNESEGEMEEFGRGLGEL
ncbi:beta-lactamase/transpeptidase-like protein [Xylariaceae sp. FL0594]|nr:beta-lactamase/transpeptidase-like protein [Xylariaceae sp. FL0594]